MTKQSEMALIKEIQTTRWNQQEQELKLQGQQLGGTSEYNTGRHHPTASGDPNNFNQHVNQSVNNENEAGHRASKSLSVVHQSINEFEAVAR